MDDPQLRSILVNIQQRLNENDRERLDLYLKNDIPRLTKVNSRLNQTLKLIQSRFDQDKIDEKQLISLMDAFQRIRCFDAVQLLKEHQHRMTSKGLKKSALGLTSIMPPHNQQLEDAHEYEYIDDTKISIQYQGNHRNSNTNGTIAQKNLIINEDKEKQLFRRKPCCCVPLLKNKCFLLLLILLLLVLGLLVFVLIGGNNLRISRNDLIKTQNETNQTVQQLNKLLSKQNTTVEQLNKTLVEIQQKRNITLIKAGQKFGGDGGGDFDDSLLSNFTSSHCMREIRFSDINDFDGCQFIYESCRDNQSRIESSVHGQGGDKITSAYKYPLGLDERIQQVQVKSVNTTFPNNYTTMLIKGMKFVTTKGRPIPPGPLLTGSDVQSENFTGYTLGYVTGKSGFRVDQLQFFWYRTE